MLVPATAEDLKKHGQITITSQVEESKKEGQASEASQANDQPAEVDKTALSNYLYKFFMLNHLFLSVQISR